MAARVELSDWWEDVEPVLDTLATGDEVIALADAIDQLILAAEALCEDRIWAEADGRALSGLLEDMRLNARLCGTELARSDLSGALRDAMDEVAVRPPYGGHPRVAVYGLLESRMARSDLVICAGLNEGSWPQAPAADALLAPAILRALGVPGAEFRIGARSA